VNYWHGPPPRRSLFLETNYFSKDFSFFQTNIPEIKKLFIRITFVFQKVNEFFIRIYEKLLLLIPIYFQLANNPRQ